MGRAPPTRETMQIFMTSRVYTKVRACSGVVYAMMKARRVRDDECVRIGETAIYGNLLFRTNCGERVFYGLIVGATYWNVRIGWVLFVGLGKYIVNGEWQLPLIGEIMLIVSG